MAESRRKSTRAPSVALLLETTNAYARQEILRVQLNRVKELLIGTELALSEIAERTGFNPAYLSAVFIANEGLVAERIPPPLRPFGRGGLEMIGALDSGTRFRQRGR